DDIYDNNDNQTDAYGVFIGWGTGDILQYDEDWYHLAANSTTMLQICVSGELDVLLGMEIWDDEGYIKNLSKPLGEYRVYLLHQITNGEDYYIRIRGAILGDQYGLYFANVTDDIYEENNDRMSAHVIAEDTIYNCVQMDEDWFEIEIQSGFENITIEVHFSDIEGNIDIELYNSAGDLIEGSDSDNNDESIKIVLGNSGMYYIRVAGDNFGQNYDIIWMGEEITPEPDDDTTPTDDDTTPTDDDTTPTDDDPTFGGIPGYSTCFTVFLALGTLVILKIKNRTTK
ncbi:MAG: hypothetical protein E4G98_03270, partial [Promethearchaeota archaeon]